MSSEACDQSVIRYIKEMEASSKRICKSSFSKEVNEYLDSRYPDSSSTRESLYRIMHGIEERPRCQRCGNAVAFKDMKSGFNKHCSQECVHRDPEVYKRGIAKKVEKYGTASSIGKIKETNMERYGVEFQMQCKEIQQKAKETCLAKHGDENYRNVEKAKETCLAKYGAEWWFNSIDCKEKTIKKLGTDNYRKTRESKQKTSRYMLSHRDEIREKVKKTCISKYGTDNVMRVQEIKSKIDYKAQKEKEYTTKKKNKSFNASKLEDNAWEVLKKAFPQAKRQYKSSEYPFACDFYIPETNTYIECNYHWTHGGKPYEATSEDLEKVQLWKSRGTAYYMNAIHTWTVRDVAKRETANAAGIDYIELYSQRELGDWIANYKNTHYIDGIQ